MLKVGKFLSLSGHKHKIPAIFPYLLPGFVVLHLLLLPQWEANDRWKQMGLAQCLPYQRVLTLPHEKGK